MLSKYIPGTKAYSYNAKRGTVFSVSRYINKFRGMASLSEDEKLQYVKTAKTHLRRVFTIEKQYDKFSNFLFFILFVPIGIYTQLVLPFILNNRYSVFKYSSWQAAGYFFIFLLFFAMITLLIILPAMIFNTRNYNRKKLFIFQGTHFFISISTAFYFSYNNLGLCNSLLANSFFAGMYSSSLYLIGIVIMLFAIIAPSEYFLKTRRLNKISDSKLIQEILELLQKSERKKLYRNFVSKRLFMFKMEECAVRFEKKMPSLLDTYDKYNNQWVRNTFKEVAFNFRSLKRDISVNGTDNKEITIVLKDYFIKILNNDWKSLIRKELPAKIKLEQAKNSGVFYFRTFFVSILPFGLIWLNNHYKILLFDGAVSHYVDIISALWFVVSILIMIDPSLKDKISTIKDVASFKGLRGEE